MPEFRSTPAPVVRRSSETPWDDAERPGAADAERAYDTREHQTGHHLVQVHDHLRGELDRVLDLIEQVEAGLLDVADARDEIAQTTMRQNSWTLGAYCASYCRLVTTHHTIEDASVFVHLRRTEPDLAPVVDRLELEHRVIHEVLERVDRALVAMVADDDLTELRAATDLLSDTLLSHLAYEERELIEPLSRLGFL